MSNRNLCLIVSIFVCMGLSGCGSEGLDSSNDSSVAESSLTSGQSTGALSFASFKKLKKGKKLKGKQAAKICSKSIKCAQGQLPTDTNNDGCVDSCVCEVLIVCAEGFLPVDNTGNGCDDACVCSTQILCMEGTLPSDSDDDGCDDSCQCTMIVDCASGWVGVDNSGNGCVDSCEPCTSVACAPGYSAMDSNGDGCDDTCQCPQILCAPGTTPVSSNGNDCFDGCAPICGTIQGLTCSKGFVCKMPDTACGSADLAGICVPKPNFCTEEYNPQCGCDGNTYGNPCELLVSGAALAYSGECCEPQDVNAVGGCEMVLGVYFTDNGCEYLSGCECEGSNCQQGMKNLAECEAKYGQCGDNCEAQDAAGEGFCAQFFGYAFNGKGCVPVSGCNCVGSDCDSLSPDPKGCHIEFEECMDPCAADDAEGVGMCLAFFGYAWNGHQCVGQSGCNCVGSDCGSLPLSYAACKKAHSQCVDGPCGVEAKK